MCGIHAIISATPLPSTDRLPTSPVLRARLRARGPDHWGQVRCAVAVSATEPVPTAVSDLAAPPTSAPQTETPDAAAATVHICLTSTVLALRGGVVAKQPFVARRLSSSSSSSPNPDDAVGALDAALCWNGEAWRVPTALPSPELRTLAPGDNDGAAVFALLRRSAAVDGDGGDDDDVVLAALRRLQGPFAFVYLCPARRRVYYGRDRLGRRSLLVRQLADNGGGGVVLSSVAEDGDANTGWLEVPADGVYVLELDKVQRGGVARAVTRHPWNADEEGGYVCGLARFNMDLPPPSSKLDAHSQSVERLRQLLTESLELRVQNVPQPPAQGLSEEDSRVAVLFSGGVDCTVLARLAHDLLPPKQSIDLINVAFENPRLVLQQSSQGKVFSSIYETCPDRITGRKSFEELCTVCPGRNWRFIAANVPYSEAKDHRPDVVSLMYPHQTEMDLSIAYALYFAARGCGHALDSSGLQVDAYRTPARVLLSGLGADELFGGYIRHATAFSRRGYAGLLAELKLDVGRLPERNLGRDDRVISHWGREVRFPYLDEDLMAWAIECPVWQKCDFENQVPDESAVEPGKRVLRLLAHDLGLKSVAREKKRAIQFGARTAKMESSKTNGTTLIS